MNTPGIQRSSRFVIYKIFIYSLERLDWRRLKMELEASFRLIFLTNNFGKGQDIYNFWLEIWGISGL